MHEKTANEIYKNAILCNKIIIFLHVFVIIELFLNTVLFKVIFLYFIRIKYCKTKISFVFPTTCYVTFKQCTAIRYAERL